MIADGRDRKTKEIYSIYNIADVRQISQCDTIEGRRCLDIEEAIAR